MDVEARYNTRFRTQGQLHRGMHAGQDDSGGESESNLVRRKFQRTATDPTDTDTTFRKPSLPASATRAAGLEHRPSLSQRRRSTLRENVRVPSGPRDFPSPSKQRLASNASVAPSVNDTTNNTRSFLPPSNSESFLYNSRAAGAASMSRERLSFGNPTNSSTDSADSPTTPADRSNGASNFEFLPDINFDDFQTSIKNYDGTSPMLSEFPSVDGGRILPGEEDYSNMARTNGFASSTRREEQSQKPQGMSRTQSLRQRLGANRQPSGGQPSAVKDSNESKPSSLRNRRQSTAPQSSAAQASTITPAASKPPRKSVGPGLLTNMMKPGAGQQGMNGDAPQKSSLARTSSLSKARRTTIQPSIPTTAGAEGSRGSTLTATTQSRQNKVKSLQPPPKGQDDPNSTPSSSKSGRSGQNRAHTPSSGSGRRQSMASGRASGLGARTISPTDARRLKRMSMNPPPMPTAYLASKAQPSPQEEIQNPMNNVPRMAQPSPSLIPRKTSNATPSSTRASPEGKLNSSGGVSLASKSSYSSLHNVPANGSSSRLPTPKPRTATQSGSSLGQYSDRQYGEGEYNEFVPPVPAIPKAFESPQDEDHRPFFSSSLKSSQSAGPEHAASTGWTEVSALQPPQRISQTPRGSLDMPAETPRKPSGEFPRHRRTNTGNSGVQIPALPGPPKTAPRAQPDPNGRKNANLQPLRLPPLNLMPIGTRALHSSSNNPALPRPSQETDFRDPTDWSVQTPEPKRTTKTPSTPMTASKATFFRRQEEKALRSSSSHYALRDVMGMDADGNMTTRYWDDSDVETMGQGVPVPNKQPRSAITPFASGSLPKSSAEYAKQIRGRPSGEYDEDPYSLGTFEGLQWQNSKPHGPRLRTGTQTTIGSMSMKSQLDVESPSINELPSLSDAKKEASAEKKEGGGLRRKLSLGWRRSSSKSANHADNKSSPQQENGERHEKKDRLQKRASEMPPPKLPASATWSGDVPSLPSSARPSIEQGSMLGHARRKSQLPSSVSQVSIPTSDSDNTSGSGHVGGVKTRALHSEQPTPVTSSTRASSWGNLGNNSRNASSKNARHKFTPSSFSAIVKDKDDYAADEEMARLSRKRKDVDSAARETEEIKRRAVPRQPVSAEAVMHDRSLLGGSQLNVFERGEVVDYEKEGIYFTGTRSARKVIGSLTHSPQPGKDSKEAGGTNNFGYDDERGDYNIVLGDHLAYRYEVVDVLGKGSFGQVVRCVDHKEGGVVAVKIIRNKKRFHQQALVEVGILGRLREWDPEGAHATLSITSSFYFRSHLCIVTPCLSINLYELIRAHNFTGFNLPLIRRFSRQLLATLTLLQSKRIIHCDLKPENILLCEARKADVRVIDFGSSCREEEKVYTYIQSRFYRSPEVILGSSYGLGIDMWSFGCILAELWTGYPLFPGENEQEQLACIMEIFGPPDRHLVERCTRKKLFFDSVGKPRVTVSSKGRRRRPSSKTLQQALKSDDDAFIDFVTRCLRWDPDRRLKPHEAVSHPFITNQPFHQRQGIPDEARRAARIRSTAAVPAANATNGGIPSPVKRGNAFAQQQQQTPAGKEKGRQLPETPQTALRNGVPSTATGNAAQFSPSKAAGGNKRHSTVGTANAAAMAGSKRASNGAVLAAGAGAGTLGAVGAQRGQSGNLAQMAARESMGLAGSGGGAAGGGVGSGRWKA